MTKDNNKVATSPNNNDQVLKAILNVPTPTKGGKASTYALNEGVANMLATKPYEGTSGHNLFQNHTRQQRMNDTNVRTNLK